MGGRICPASNRQKGEFPRQKSPKKSGNSAGRGRRRCCSAGASKAVMAAGLNNVGLNVELEHNLLNNFIKTYTLWLPPWFMEVLINVSKQVPQNYSWQVCTNM